MSLRAAIRARRARPLAARTRSNEHGGSEPKMRIPGSLSAVPGSLQRMSVLGPENDAYEREANTVAEQVGAGEAAPSISPIHAGGASGIQREHAMGGASTGAATAATAVQSGGRALNVSERGFFEPRFGQDLSAVRIHDGPEVDQAAARIGARAYTVGTHIAVASGEYSHDTATGRRLMAHELAHTLQQSGGAAGRVRRQSIPDLPDIGDLTDRAGRWGERQWDRGERYLEKGAKKAGEIADSAQEGAENWWNRGSGGITRIDFDGAEVKVSGTASATYKAVSGLMPHAKQAKGMDYTAPEYQAVPDKGPIPEGDYYLDPAEVESNPPGRFRTSAWGKYRTRLHETLGTNIWRRATTERTGGFYLHQDANHNGTAGCIGIWKTKDNADIHAKIKANADIHAKIKANAAQIPVHVKYKAAPATTTKKKTTGQSVQRLPVSAPLGQRTALFSPTGGVPGQHVQRDPKRKAPKKKKPHYLITAGIDKISADLAKFKTGAFPSDYYDTLARHLYQIALRKTRRDYGDAFSLLNDLQWNTFGPDLQNHYTRIVGTDSANGWDKFRHFVFTAYLQYYSAGFLAPEGFTYGKELFDEAEQFFGKDPEGYSVPDIRADNRGEKFAEEMADQRDRERIAAAKRTLALGVGALIDPRTYGVGF